MEEQHADDQSHYEISLTAGQAFIAFVLLLLSLAASFAFGLMLGKGQADERLVVRKESPVVTEASLSPKKAGEIVELGVDANDFDENAVPASAQPAATDSSTTVVAEHSDDAAPAADAPAPSAEPVDTPAQKPAAESAPAAAQPETKPVVAPAKAPAHPAAEHAAYFAQLLSTGDQKTAEGLAVKLINRGFDSAYVERGSTEKGPVFRVRVRFGSESEARSAEPKLREFSKEVWITAR